MVCLFTISCFILFISRTHGLFYLHVTHVTYYEKWWWHTQIPSELYDEPQKWNEYIDLKQKQKPYRKFWKFCILQLKEMDENDIKKSHISKIKNLLFSFSICLHNTSNYSGLWISMWFYKKLGVIKNWYLYDTKDLKDSCRPLPRTAGNLPGMFLYTTLYGELISSSPDKNTLKVAIECLRNWYEI